MKREEAFGREEIFLRLRAENSQAKKASYFFREKKKRSNQWTLNTLCVKNKALS